MKTQLALVMVLTVGLAGCSRQQSQTIDTSMMQAPASPQRSDATAMSSDNSPMANDSAPMPSEPAPMAQEPSQPQRRLSYKLPAGWSEEPGGADMRYATLHGPDGLEITITVFGGDVGGTLANVNRWRRQMGLTAVTDADLDKNITRVQTQAGDAMVVDLSSNGQRMLAAILPDQNQTWFFKLMGPQAKITKHAADYMNILKSVSLGAGGGSV